jgi:hypothetical protein
LEDFRSDGLHDFGGNVFVEGLFEEFDFEILADVFDELRIERGLRAGRGTSFFVLQPPPGCTCRRE